MKDSVKEMIQLMGGKVNLVHALSSKWGEGVWSYSGKDSDYSGLKWLSEDIEKPSQSEIEKEIERLQDEYDAHGYARDRQSEYPPIQDQLDYIYHNSITKWKSDMIKPVKDAHPKP
jgi:predicted lipoprotein